MISGRSAARSARMVRDHEVGGSNPPAPTNVVDIAGKLRNLTGLLFIDEVAGT